MSKTSEFPIDVLEIQFHFGNAKTFEMVQKVKFSIEKFSPKCFAFLKKILYFQNMDWEFRSLGHKPNQLTLLALPGPVK